MKNIHLLKNGSYCVKIIRNKNTIQKSFPTLEEAKEFKEEILGYFSTNRELPEYVEERDLPRGISRVRKSYQVQMTVSGVRVRRYFRELDDAISFREELLNSDRNIWTNPDGSYTVNFKHNRKRISKVFGSYQEALNFKNQVLEYFSQYHCLPDQSTVELISLVV
jgi:hypothetical protein